MGYFEIFVDQAKRFVTKEDVLEEVKRRKISFNVQNEDLLFLDVAQIQTRRHHFGYEPRLVGGTWGKKTDAAFQKFLNDNAQADLSQNSLFNEPLLYDLYKETFEQPVVSSVPCTSITSDYERTNKGESVVIAHFNEASSNLVNPDKGDETTAIWDKFSAFSIIRILTDSCPEVIIWAWDVPKKTGLHMICQAWLTCLIAASILNQSTKIKKD